MAFKLAEAYVEFSQKGVAQVKSGVDKVKGSFSSAAGSAKLLAGAVAGIGAAGALRGLWSFVEAAAEAERQTAKLEAVLKSTGGVSGQTVGSLEAHASALQKVTAFEDDTIKGAQAVLLTFKKIGGETFPQATEAALDLATVFEGDLRGSAMMVGKALEDPIRGITALRRAGVSFTADQQDVIKSLVKTGEVAKAQAMILKEINSQVGGSARKVGDTTFGQIEQLKNAMGDLAEEIGGALTPAIKVATSALRSLSAGAVPVSMVQRMENKAAATTEFEQLTRNLNSAESQQEVRKAMAAINSFMAEVPLRGVDPSQFEGIRDKSFKLARGRMPYLPGETAAAVAGQQQAAAAAADQRYRDSQKKVQSDLRMQGMTKAVNQWESLRNVDFGSLRGMAADEKRAADALQVQTEHLKAIREQLSYKELLDAMAARYH